MRNEQEPTEEKRTGGGHLDGEKTYRHPAFGQIGASRCQGGNLALYGSDFRHDSFIRIHVSRSAMHRTLSLDWHHAGDELVEVYLSEAQWASFVSTLNSGTGTTCTIAHVGREQMPAIPLRDERSVVHKELEERTARVAEHLRAAIAGVEVHCAGLSKIKRDAVLERLIRAEREVSDCMPFAAESFSEHVETTVEKAKIEVEAYIHGRIQRAGLQALGKIGDEPIKLGESKP